jgi:diguanylate cyclase (GGDEF)-like protein
MGSLSRWRLLRERIASSRAINREIKGDALEATVNRIFWTAPVMAVGNFLAGLGFWFQELPTGATEILWRELIIKMNFLVSMGSLVIWILTCLVKKKQASVKVQTILVYSVVTYVLSIGLGIAVIDSLVMTSITPFLICVTIVGTFYYLPPANSLVVFVLSFTVFRLSFVFFGTMSTNVLSSTLVNGLVANVMGLALSIVNWQHFRRARLQERTIVAQQVQLTQMAYHDSLTGLPNRRFLDELVDREVALVKKGQVQSSLIICDVDRFKEINDTYGHLAGDDILCAFAQLLKANLGQDSTVVRLGGEEFVILASHTTQREAAALAERLRKTVEEHEFTVDQTTVRITASFGVAALRGTEGSRDYYHSADQALYAAKRSGRNSVYTFSELVSQEA